MTSIGTPLKTNAKKILLLGAGELGKELVISLQRLGCEVIACDCYDHAPAMQVAHRSYTFSMLDAQALKSVITQEKPDFVVPEIEAIATDALLEIEQGSKVTVVPSARAVHLTMNREGIRKFAATELKLRTSNYCFANSLEDLCFGAKSVDFPCVIKPVMSSSGKGQTIARSEDDLKEAWRESQEGGRTGASKVIVEGFVEFDIEITLLTVRHRKGTTFCAPIGHRQEDGDYRESWQPQKISEIALKQAQNIARQITDGLGGYGLFGVELFIKGDDVWFSEVSPRPHDTGLVTLISQRFTQFDLHARAFLGLSVPAHIPHEDAASVALLVKGTSLNPCFGGLDQVTEDPLVDLRLFGKPEIIGQRRLGVILALGSNTSEAINRAQFAQNIMTVTL